MWRALLFSSCMKFVFSLFSFFFFQAEDGIRDKLVTGVQTCALPISLSLMVTASVESGEAGTISSVSAWRISEEKTIERPRAILARAGMMQEIRDKRMPRRGCNQIRSEERRVGKE